MQKTMIEDKAYKLGSVNGIDIFQIKTEKFKTSTINVFFHDNLTRESASMNAMIPAVLRRGCRSQPTFRDISLYLEELYGASFDCGVTKKGERQVIQFYMDFVSDKYTLEKTGQFEKALGLLFEIITSPVLENGSFKKEYVDQEKDNLTKLIEGRVNDKMQYSVERCYEEMCSGERFGIYDYGSVEDLASLDGGKLYKGYKEMLETYPAQVFLSGSIEEGWVEILKKKLSDIKRGSIKQVDISKEEVKTGKVKNIIERMDVNQSKLTLGFRTRISSNSEKYYPLIVYNGILGGGIHSKLFQNVREKASLAYYVFSRLEKFKGLMVISSGVEAANKEKAVEIIMQQIEELKKGNISDYEFNSTLKTLETGIQSMKDSQLQMVDYYLSQTIVETEDDFETLSRKLREVTRKAVVDAASSIELDTVYFLTGKESRVNEA